jgi:hypothetical protein
MRLGFCAPLDEALLLHDARADFLEMSVQC